MTVHSSAVLNPQDIPLCIDPARGSATATLSLQINQTTPILIELLRLDLETGHNETISISASQAKKLKKEAEKRKVHRPNTLLVLYLPVKKTGLYRLLRVLDETKLEVQRRSSEALVVACPSAAVETHTRDRCRGELSNLSLLVSGTPPLKIRYREIVQGKKDREVSYQSIQPEGFLSPLIRQQDEQALIRPYSLDFNWATSHAVRIPLNETLTTSGKLSFSIDEITDALGNTVSYSQGGDESTEHTNKKSRVEETLVIHELPTISWPSGVERPLRVAKRQARDLPLVFSSSGKAALVDARHIVHYRFTPFHEMSSNGEHSDQAQLKQWDLEHARMKPSLREPGLYSIESVATPHCKGEVLEPKTVLLINPDEPDLSITTEAIADKCAGNSIGLHVSLEMSGTPPFQIQYTVKKPGRNGHDTEVAFKTFTSLRGQIEFRPEQAGHHTYMFTEIKDKLYSGISLKSKNLILEQDVKPSVSAQFLTPTPQRFACIDEAVSFDVKFQGEGPWALDYEIVHAGKRSKKSISDIESEFFTVTTDVFTDPGDYTLVLASVKDRFGCRESLQNEGRVKVSGRPKVGFGHLEGKRQVQLLESRTVGLPIRLSGQAPWTVDYHRIDGDAQPVESRQLSSANDILEVKDAGNYQLTRVRDSLCPGSVDQDAATFQVDWIARPRITVASSSLMEQTDGKYVRKAVCEGEEDAIDIYFSGRPPYEVSYQERLVPEHGSKSIKDQKLSVAFQSTQVKMDTHQAGQYEYIVTELGDYNYDHNPKKHQPMVVSQQVNARPSMKFTNPGRVYSFCQGDEEGADAETLPILFTGIPPFSMDFDVKHSNRIIQSQSITIPNIPSTNYKLQVPHRMLKSGNSILTIRGVRDSQGCERRYDAVTAPHVQLAVHDLPTITPLDDRIDVCVGDRIGFAMSGIAPFSVFYRFEGSERKASVDSSTFRRIAESPGVFEVASVQDAASQCRMKVSNIRRTIHALPSVRVSRGHETSVDIHAGGEAEILFEFGGVPPFEFTFTRSENARTTKGAPGAVIETRTLKSDEMTLRITASEEGTYEVVAIRDRYCSFARPGVPTLKGGRKLLMN